MAQTLSEIVAEAWPLINEYLEPRLAAISGSASSTSTDTTALSPADYPDALLRDGSRSLLGNLSVASGVTIDSVDISEFYESYISHLSADAHSIYVEKNSADTITAIHTFSPSTATAPFILAANAQNQTVTGLQADSLDQSVIAGTGLTGGGVLTSNVTLNVGAGAGLVGNADDIAVGAGTGITVNADDVAVDQTFSPTWTGTHQFNNTVNSSSIIPRATDTYDLGSSTKLFRKGWLSEMEALLFVENSISVIGGWFYITKDQGVLAADVSTIDTTIDFGKAMTINDFVVMRTSLAVEYVKVISLSSGTRYNVTRNLDGSGANAWVMGTVFAVLGNTGNGRIELNASDSPRIQVLQQGSTYNAQTELIRLGDLNGNWGYAAETYGLAIGEYGSNKPNITADPTNGLRIRSHTTDKLTFDTSGNASIAGSFTIGTSGGIYQGTGTFASPTTGLKLFNSSGIGVLAGYNAGAVQAQFDTTGKLTAGGGLVILDSAGITITPTTARSATRAYKFIASGDTFGGMYSSGSTTTHSVSVRAESVADHSADVSMVSTANGASRTGSITLSTTNTTNTTAASVTLEASTVSTITMVGRIIHSDYLTLGSTAFPASPATDYIYARTDRDAWAIYDGTRWQTMYESAIPWIMPSGITFAANATAAHWVLRSDLAAFIRRLTYSVSVTTTHTATDYWTIATSTSGGTAIYSFNSYLVGVRTAANTEYRIDVDETSLTNQPTTTPIRVQVVITKVGAPGNLNLVCGGSYRQVLT